MVGLFSLLTFTALSGQAFAAQPPPLRAVSSEQVAHKRLQLTAFGTGMRGTFC